jgi:hypothetical protein
MKYTILLAILLFWSCTQIYFDRKHPVNSPDIPTPKAMNGTYISQNEGNEKPDTLIIANGKVVKSDFLQATTQMTLRRLSPEKLILNIEDPNFPQKWICVLLTHNSNYNKLEVFTLPSEGPKYEKICSMVDTATFEVEGEKNRALLLKANENDFSGLVKMGFFEKIITYKKISQ